MSVGSYKKSEWFVTLTFFLPKNRRLLYEIPHILRSQGFVVSWRARGRIICVTQLIQCLRSNVTLQHNFSRVFEHVPRAIYQPTAFSTHSSRSTRPIQLNSAQLSSTQLNSTTNRLPIFTGNPSRMPSEPPQGNRLNPSPTWSSSHKLARPKTSLSQS